MGYAGAKFTEQNKINNLSAKNVLLLFRHGNPSIIEIKSTPDQLPNTIIWWNCKLTN